ncbi:hypothetical protein 10S11_12 [uncultured Caudovirales phage]|uniref:Phage portal protein n=1 Tax=uncultured Caudovirales phage TaxID=2100421 RepID=A0A2H4J031_9CAUD|nr:hypothetical protein 10S11_12 [uncultured Caudovirales phage]
MDKKDIKDKLLGLSESEIKDREKSFSDLLFYIGECEDSQAACLDSNLLGQSWLNIDDLDYIPSQVIDNKVKPLINKQARFMMGVAPNLQFKPFDKELRKECEELKQFVDGILKANRFWSNTLKAFKIATITKRVLLRMEANPDQPVRLYYHDISEFSYELDSNDYNKLSKAIVVKIDNETQNESIENQIWYRYTYYMKGDNCWFKSETFIGNQLEKPIDILDIDTKLSKIPCWLIANESDMVNKNGISDIKDLRPLQEQINARTSDFADALRFDMFTQTAIIDASEETTNKAKIAPNAMLPLASLQGKNAEVKKIESTFQNAEAVEKFLKRMDDSMHEKLDIPKPEQLKNVPSAKTLKYVYNELISRCSEKWNDWEPPIRAMIRLIINACGKFNCYEDWDHEWDSLLFNIVLKKNYPIPEDEDDKKRLAMEEVRANVKSHKSYIRDFTDDEDPEGVLKEIAEDIITITAAEQDQFQKALNEELEDGNVGDE